MVGGLEGEDLIWDFVEFAEDLDGFREFAFGFEVEEGTMVESSAIELSLEAD